ncbi:MAG: hypothetical protein EHV01_005195 [Spiroplasma sp. hy2]|uniref:hypothetical protein n=1 Tax=Spiroplasma sp. hy2 TaxID=2490850 RepID=UPI00383DCA5D
MKHSFNQKTGKYYSCKIRNINIYLNENEQKVWNEFNDFTYSQRIEHLINYYIVNERKKDN